MQFLCFRGARRGSGSTRGELSPEPSSSKEHCCTSEEAGEPSWRTPQAAPVAFSGSGGRPTAQTLDDAASDLIASLEAGPRDDDSSSSPHQSTGCSQQDTSAAPCGGLRASIDSRRCSVGSGGSGRRPSTAGVAETSSSCTLDAKPPGRISTDALLVQLGQAAAAAMDAPSTTAAAAPLAGRYSGRLSGSSGGGGSRNSSSGGAGSSSRAQQVQRAGEVLSASARAALLHKVSAALAAGAELGEMLQSLPAAGGYARNAASRQQLQLQMQRRRSLQGMRAGVAAAQPHRHKHTRGGAATSPDDSLAREVVQQQCQAQEQHQEQEEKEQQEQQGQECHEQPPAPAAVLSGQQQGAGFRRLSSLGSLPGLGATASSDLLAALSDSEVLLLLQSVQGEVLAAQQQEDEEHACGNQQQLEPIAASVLTRYEDQGPSRQPAAQGVAAGSSGGGGKQAAAAAKALCAASGGPLLLHERQPLMLLTDAEWGADWQPRAGQHEEEEEDAAAAGVGACGPAGAAAAAEACGDKAADADCAPVGAVLTHRLMTYEHVTTVVWRDSSDTAGGAAQREPALEAALEAAAEPEAAAPAAAEAPATRASRQATPAAAAARRLTSGPSPPPSPAAGSAARSAAIKTAPPSSRSSSCAQQQERAQAAPTGTGAAARARSSPQVKTPRSGRAPGGARSPTKAAQPAASMAASGGAAAGLRQVQDSSGSSGVRHKEEVARRTPAPAAASPFAAAAAAGGGLVSSPRPAALSPRPSAAAARLATHSRAVGVVSSRGRSASPTKSSPHRSGTLVAFGRTLPRPPSPDKLEQHEPAAAAASGVEPLSKQGNSRVQASLQDSKQQRRRQPGRAASLPARAPAAGSKCLPRGCEVSSRQLALHARPPSVAAAGAATESLQTGLEGVADGHAVHPEPGSHLLLRVPSPTTTVWGSSGDCGQPSRPSGLLSCPVAAGSWSLEAQQHCRHHSCERLFSGGSAATPGAAAAGGLRSGLHDILALVRQLQGNLVGLESDMQQLNGVMLSPLSPTGQE